MKEKCNISIKVLNILVLIMLAALGVEHVYDRIDKHGKHEAYKHLFEIREIGRSTYATELKVNAIEEKLQILDARLKLQDKLDELREEQFEESEKDAYGIMASSDTESY